MITDYHVHLETGPYDIDWVKKYLELARSNGVDDLGFSEHAYRFRETRDILFNPWIEERQTERIEEYVGLVLRAKDLGLPVKLGIEMDFIPGKEREIERFLEKYPWDYVIGSVHWLGNWGFDLAEMKDGWKNRSIIEVYQEYFDILKDLLSSNLFHILGHIDVIKVMGHKPLGYDKKRLDEIYDGIIPYIKKSDITVEMSTAGLRKPVGELYPSRELMEKITSENIPMMINSDAHRPEDVGRNFKEGLEYLRSFGVDEISTFEDGERRMKKLG